MRLNEKKVGHDRAESAERGDKAELADFFAEIKIDCVARVELSMLQRQSVLARKFRDAECEQHRESEENAAHSSLP